ncbi:MAG: tRNA-dihydrouridine synthase family protein [Desulforhopalus sp.]|nr:tRNA-dihydrouridine synthase family protein [Desulforhopalus sp.]
MDRQSFPHTLKIQGIEISPPIALAPMVGLSHSAFRTLVQEEGGVGLLFTEMLVARRLPHDNEHCSPLLIKRENEHPLFYQLVTANEQAIGPAIEKLHKLGAHGIDLNLGCPAPLQKKQGAGLALVENQSEMCRVLHSLRKSTELPISVKIRLGKQLDSQKLSGFCRLLEDMGVNLITIHARLNNEKFCRRPRWDAIGKIRRDISVPLLVNGGIFSVQDAKESLEQSGADGLMVGRGAVERPWLCAEIAKKVFGIDVPESRKSDADIFFKFLKLLEDRFTPERRLGRLKQFATYFASPFPFGHHFAASIQSSITIDQAKQRASEFFAQNV